MNLLSTRANYGLRSAASFTSSAVSGSPQIGLGTASVNIPAANSTWAAQALLVGSTTDLVITLASANSTGTTAWTAGTAQVETATAAGTITASGNAAVVVTASDMTGSPKTINVAVANTDTAATWAGKVRTALAADADVSALFTVGGTTTAISLTRKPLGTYTVGSASVSTYPANDTSLNISLDNGTCTGITTAATSTNTTAGVATAGCYLADGDGKDFEGNTLTAIASNSLGGFLIKNHSDSPAGITVTTDSSMLVDFYIPADGVLQFCAANCDGQNDNITVEPLSTALVSIISTGATA